MNLNYMQNQSKVRAAVALFRRELSANFQTPVAYVAGAIFLAVTATLFFSLFFVFQRVEMRNFFSYLPILLAILMPALAMRVIAEEKRRGTWEILTTLPLNNTEIVIAKFAAIMTTGLFLLIPTLFFTLTVSLMGPLDPGPVVAGYIGAILLVGVYTAIGLFSSSVAGNETVALILGLVIALFFALLDVFLVLVPTPLVDLFEFLSIGYHFSGFSKGLIDSRSIIYLLSLIIGFLTLTQYRLNRQQ